MQRREFGRDLQQRELWALQELEDIQEAFRWGRRGDHRELQRLQ